ncbi:30S ribosomal protein S9 [Candidatus Nomurabacteria bacterium RIFCSPLOWO2_01_FULL_40_15]|uniref:30S ribosomal protein S9 n=1 Tax=Candidatus Nomurabacteria bacterium RIFCSPLOWO2_01_FULL_40_15 TaxID=1801772 RepID=A0A1F6X7P9_9BACT|nr:MAG: 30S ribosomal protein S9 [Candidatus Nomurabacteria bacterium RIFCSPLOWO2_01_FULL_40_15]
MEKTEKEKSINKYWEAVGRRKTSTARVRIWQGAKAGFVVNGKEGKKYFQTEDQRHIIQDSIIKGLPASEKTNSKWIVEVKVSGGGIHSQSEAIRHGLARALIKYNPEFRGELKDLGFLRRDPRAKERRKFGLKKARKAPQWSKR